MSLELPDHTVHIGDYDFSQVHTYSDLDYTEYEISLYGDREITRDASAYVGVAYYDLTDDQPYVYGDVGGSVLRTEAGVGFTF